MPEYVNDWSGKDPRKDRLFRPKPGDEDYENPFKIQLSDFMFVNRNIKSGKALRLTVTWSFLHPEFGLLGESIEGGLVIRTADSYRYSPPVSRFGPNQSKHQMMITVDFHDLIIRLLKEHKTKAGVSYLDYVGSEVPEALRPKRPADVDPELPLQIGEEVKD